MEILTGIKAHTIRMWEKRYGLLKPQRTTTQIRTYSNNDLLLLLNVSLLYKKGIKISRIADMSNEQIYQASRSLQHSEDTDTAIEQFIVSVLQLDEQLFQKTFQELTYKSDLSVIFSEHIIPFLNRIGVMWLVGTINPAQEHFISNLIRQKIIAAIDQLPVPDSKQVKIILYLPEHEWHEISLLVYHYHLRSKGLNSIYLGQALPYDALIKAVTILEPECLVSSWLTAIEPQKIRDHFHQLETDLGPVTLIAGGYQIDQLESFLSKKIKRIRTLSDLELFISP
ncbi:MerR family transcriptional regulator [Fluviicola chungangensis]|uniref:MerR family transcriptional regulator n=1 Tax=Fluviicola chungangensis TaxID=2597671 RepID=UPI001642B639